MTTCRVGDFNGLSLSALSRSVVTVEPAGDEAEALRNWWATEGQGQVGEPSYLVVSFSCMVGCSSFCCILRRCPLRQVL